MAEPAAKKAKPTDSGPQLIIDCDPGGDDVVAIMWVLALQRQNACRLVALTTTEGNVKAPSTFNAADKLLAFYEATGLSTGSPIPVFAQSPKAARWGTTAERKAARKAYAAQGDGGGAAYIHGNDGMGGLSSRLPSRKVGYDDAGESCEHLVQQLTARPGELTLLATGPLTNLADAERRQPGVLKLAKQIVMMGGSLEHGGNLTPLAEFNWAYDPHAANLVVENSGLTDIMLMPLDLTTHMVCTDKVIQHVVGRNLMQNFLGVKGEEISPEATPYAFTAGGWRLFFRDLTDTLCRSNMAFKDVNGATGFLVHDASTVAALFYPETLRFRRAQVRVVAEEPGEGSHALGGFSFVDSRHTAKVPGSQNCWVGEAHDAGAALSIMVQDLKMLVEAAPMPISHPAYSVSSPRAMVASGGGGGGGGGGGVPVAVVSSW